MNILLKTAVVMAASIALAPAISHAAPTVSNPKDSYTVLQRDETTIDGTSNSLVYTFAFDLPDTVVTDTAVGKSAVLQLEVRNSDHLNQVYINPPTTVCTDNATDANDDPTAPEGSASIGFLNQHDDINAKTEWFANTNAFSSEKLHSGENTLMICVRDAAGNVNTSTTDSIKVRNMMLLYKEE
jgi:hypothetical protein